MRLALAALALFAFISPAFAQGPNLGGIQTVTDGTNTVQGAKQLTVSGGTVSGDSSNVVITVTGGGSGCTVGGGSNGQLLYNNGASGCTSSTNALLSGGVLELGNTGSVAGGVEFFNATSGHITIAPPTGALGTIAITIPASAGTLALTSQLPTAANPSATAGPSANNGSASTFMRSDASPAVQVGSATQEGILQVDGTTITAAAGTISAVQPTAANPTATAGSGAVNGTSTHFMRADAAPAVQLATISQPGLVQPDNSTITISAGVISSVGGGATGANPTATASNTSVNGSATTFMRSDAAPAIQLASAGQFGLVKVDNTTITASGGIISAAAAGVPAYISATAAIANIALYGGL